MFALFVNNYAVLFVCRKYVENNICRPNFLDKYLNHLSIIFQPVCETLKYHNSIIIMYSKQIINLHTKNKTLYWNTLRLFNKRYEWKNYNLRWIFIKNNNSKGFYSIENSITFSHWNVLFMRFTNSHIRNWTPRPLWKTPKNMHESKSYAILRRISAHMHLPVQLCAGMRIKLAAHYVGFPAGAVISLHSYLLSTFRAHSRFCVCKYAEVFSYVSYFTFCVPLEN